jgi:hypothetical protein
VTDDDAMLAWHRHRLNGETASGRWLDAGDDQRAILVLGMEQHLVTGLERGRLAEPDSANTMVMGGMSRFLISSWRIVSLPVRASTRVISPAVSTSAWPADAVAEASAIAHGLRAPSDPVRSGSCQCNAEAQGCQSGVKEVSHHVLLN